MKDGVDDKGYYRISKIIKKRINGLDDPFRWNIVEILMNYGQLGYTELLDKLDAKNKKSLFNYHIKILLERGVLNRTEDMDNDRAFYSVSSITKKIINSLLSVVDYTIRSEGYTTIIVRDTKPLFIPILISNERKVLVGGKMRYESHSESREGTIDYGSFKGFKQYKRPDPTKLGTAEYTIIERSIQNE